MSSASTDFNLQPAPRILPMLGEINLSQWRCLAELIDNAIDGFLSALRDENALSDPSVVVNLPTRDQTSARITVTDNGPGMTADHLEKAVRAGWSGNSPVESLGMFGMGFNIATARLGTATTVWTSQSGDLEEHGLRIDFDELRKQGHFRTPRLTRPKVDPAAGGTMVTIESLKPGQRAWFGRPANRRAVKKKLARAYSAMLRSNSVPLTFTLTLNDRPVSAIDHCVWDEERSVDTTRHGTVHAVQKIDRSLPDRPFCTSCWQWLTVSDPACPACGGTDNVIQRKRRVHGWIGLQRHLSSTDYGIDFIRNGRKIEMANRDLFSWHDPTTGSVELEYPIDDPRQRGRFVGEVHLDHSRVTYMKDRFDRTDPAWSEMVGIVRGEGPLQPQKAASLGLSKNDSPLFRLYQAFRRSSPPKARVAGGWSNVLVVKDNDLAEEMAKKFHEGVASYQTDQKWWELVDEEDKNLLIPPPATGAGGGVTSPLSGFATPPSGNVNVGGPNQPAPQPNPVPTAVRTSISSLSREFRHDLTGLRWDIRAFEVQPHDPDLGGEGRPWLLRKEPPGTDLFLLNTKHAVFRSATMTSLDAVLCEIAHRAADFARDNADTGATFADILATLRERYGGPLKLDPMALLSSVELLFRNIARAWRRGIEATDATALFNDLPSGDRDGIYHKMATRSVGNPQQVISEGRFLEFTSPRTVVDFVLANPDLFFDDRCWEDLYTDLNYAQPSATETARRQVLRHYEALLLDALWLSEQAPDDLEVASRERVLRATLAVELLTPISGDN